MKHIVENTPYPKNISLKINLATFFQPLRRQIQRSSDKRLRKFLLIIKLNTQPKINQVYMSFLRHHNIFWFHIPIQHIILMQELDRHYQLAYNIKSLF